MKSLELDAHLNPDSTLTVPADVAAQIRTDQALHVILAMPDSEEDGDWNRFAIEQFFAGDDPGDIVYSAERSAVSRFKDLNGTGRAADASRTQG